MRPASKKSGLAAGWICVMQIKGREVPSSAVAAGTKNHCEGTAMRLNARSHVDVRWVARECSR